MPLGKRWIGCMLIGIGLILFGVSHQHWQEWSGFAVLGRWHSSGSCQSGSQGVPQTERRASRYRPILI